MGDSVYVVLRRGAYAMLTVQLYGSSAKSAVHTICGCSRLFVSHSITALLSLYMDFVSQAIVSCF